MSTLGAERACRCGVLVMSWTDGRQRRVVEVYGEWHQCPAPREIPLVVREVPPLAFDGALRECACGTVVWQLADGHKRARDGRHAHACAGPRPPALPLGPYPHPPVQRPRGATGFVEL